jgi:hypothetical protein
MRCTAQDVAHDDHSCDCGRDREEGNELCFVCDSSAFASLELEVERASNDKSMGQQRDKKQDEKEPVLVDDRDNEFTAQESDNEDDIAQADVEAPAPAKPAMSDSAPKKRGTKRKASNKVADAASTSAPKVQKAEQPSSAATTSRSRSASKSASASKQRTSTRLTGFD